MPSCRLIKNFFSCVSLSACSICRGTIGASPGPNLSAQSAAAPCNIYTGCLHNIATIQAIVWSDVSIKEQQAPVPSASAHSLCNSSGEKFSHMTHSCWPSKGNVSLYSTAPLIYTVIIGLSRVQFYFSALYYRDITQTFFPILRVTIALSFKIKTNLLKGNKLE